MLESFSAPCFVHTLQLIIKDSLFSENNISVLIAKARQTVGHFNHSSTACEKLKNIQVILGSYFMLKRLEKLKLSVKSYGANNNNFKLQNILTADE